MSAASAPVRGNAGILAKFTLDDVGAVAKDFDNDIKALTVEGEDKDDSDLTFAEAAAGETTVSSVAITAIQSTAVGSFWRYCWDNPGKAATLVYAPHGNAVATADKPHFLMEVKLGPRPKIGTEATVAKDRADFEVALEVTDGPTLDDGA